MSFTGQGRIKDVQAWGYGLLMGLLVMHGLAYSGQPFWLWFDDSSGSGFAWLAPWLNRALVAVSLASLLSTVFQQHLLIKPHSTHLNLTKVHLTKVHWGVFFGAAVLLLITFYAPGVGQGVVVLLLGFAIGHRLLVGLGVLLLLMGIGRYYYWLDAALLTKSLTLLVIAGLLLLLRWGLRRWLDAFIAQSRDGSLDNDV